MFPTGPGKLFDDHTIYVSTVINFSGSNSTKAKAFHQHGEKIDVTYEGDTRTLVEVSQSLVGYLQDLKWICDGSVSTILCVIFC